jgi:hypothetical protein
MKLHPHDLRRPAGAIAVLATAAGLVLTGCGGSGGSGSGSGSPAAGSSSPAATSSSSGSGGSGSTSTASTGFALFPIAAGNTWSYKEVSGIAGSGAGGTSVNKMVSVTPVSGGQKVDMASTITTDGNTNHTSAYYIFESNGSISVPFSQFSSADSSTDIKLISGGIFWPPASQLASGQATHSTLKIEYVLNGKEQKVDAHITVKGAGTQTVTVPAGTYDNASIVEMTMTEAVEGYNVSIEVKTWLASGVGPVKSEAILGGITGTDTIASKDELVSFTKG